MGAGIADSAVLKNYPSVLGHAFVAAFCILWMQRCTCAANPRRYWRGDKPLERSAAALAWALSALAICCIVPEEVWPYALSTEQMLAVFLSFLMLFAVIQGSC
jgi:hypothetical protein